MDMWTEHLRTQSDGTPVTNGENDSCFKLPIGNVASERRTVSLEINCAGAMANTQFGVLF